MDNWMKCQPKCQLWTLISADATIQ